MREALAAALHRSDEFRFVHRLHAMLLLSLGRSCGEVARWFGDDPRSIERWLHAYEAHGLDGLYDHRGGGRPAVLSDLQMQALCSDLAAGPAAAGYGQARWSGKLLALHLERRYGVALGLRQCQRLLHDWPAAASAVALGAGPGMGLSTR